MREQDMTPQAKNFKGKRVDLHIGIIGLLAVLWPFFVWIWSIVMLGIVLGVLGNAAFTLLTTGTLAFTGTVSAVAWLSAHLVPFVAIITPILILTICSLLAFRQQQRAMWEQQQAHDDSLVVIAKGVKRALDELKDKPAVAALPSSPVEQEALSPQMVWNVPYRRNLFFTGRETLLMHVHDRLTSSKAAALTQAQAISGLGGIGKTQIALEYAYRYKDDYQAIFWVRAATRENIVTDFAEIARRLALPEKDEQNQDLVVAGVQHWLMAHANWLLIFDNADEPHIVADFLPSLCSGHILLTTRAGAMGNLAESIQVEKMRLQEGIELVLRRARILKQDMSWQQVSPQDQLTAQRIVEAMDGLPLALDQAGAYIEEMGCRLADYLTLYTTSRKELLKHSSRFASHATVATTFTLALQKVNQTNAAAADLLCFLAFLDPDTIPEELIVEGAFALGTTLQTMAQHPLTFQASLGLLRTFSLIRRNADTATLAIHRLVQAVIKDEMDEQAQRQWAGRAVRAVEHVFPYDEPAPWPRSQRYLAHAQVGAELIKQWDITLDEASALLDTAGLYLRNRGHYQEAAPLLQHALAIGETRYGRDHPSTRDLLHSLASLYHNQGKDEQAESLYQRALAIDEKALGYEHPTTKRIRENYTNLLQKRGQKTDEVDQQN